MRWGEGQREGGRGEAGEGAVQYFVMDGGDVRGEWERKPVDGDG